MEIILIRHGDPDYANDTLTPKGHEEAKKLADFLADKRIDAIFQSPNGRAQHTCDYTARMKGIKPVTLKWLGEVGIRRGELYLWNAPGPLFLSGSPLPTYDNWHKPGGAMPEGKAQFDRVSSGFDEVMASFGYVKKGNLYKIQDSNDKVVAFFCHHGVTATLLSYLIHWPLPLTFIHSFVDTTEVTKLKMIENNGFAHLKMFSLNSLAHLER